jgi:TolA-binding protein
MKTRIQSLGGMRSRLVFLVAWSLIPAGSVHADFSDDLAKASAPTSDGVPDVAIVRLHSLAKQNLTPDQRRLLAENLVQALIAANRPGEAVSVIQQNKLDQTASDKFWWAQALASLGQTGEALARYNAAAADNQFLLRNDAIFGSAEMLRALNRSDDAIQRLSPLLQIKAWQTRTALSLASLYLDKNDSQNARRALKSVANETPGQRKQRRFLTGRLELVEGHPDRALAYLEPLTKKPREITHPVMVATLFLIADAHLQLKTPETGDDFLEDFIDHHPADAALPELFAKLDELYRAEKKPVRAELERWTREAEQPRRGLAQWFLARIELRAGRRDRVRQLLGALRSSHADLPDLAAGLLELAELDYHEDNWADVIALVDDAIAWRPPDELKQRFQFLSARAQYAMGNFQSAVGTFQRLGRPHSPFAAAALYNASLGWLQLGDHVRFTTVANELPAPGDDRAELQLQEGLLRAKQQQPDAADRLRKFIADFPENSRVSEAWVALAELAFHQNGGGAEEARKLLARAAVSKPTQTAKERADYLTIWIEDAAGANSDHVIDLAKQFLAQYRASPFAGDVRMKLAEVYYLRQDFSNAQTQFELFAQQNPSSPLAEKAIFFAAESSMASMAPHTLDRAISMFDQVAQMKGELRWAARNEQALIERKLGKPQDALLLYEEVLKNDARPGEKREALCGKGDIYFELSTTDPKNYDRAIQAYDELATSTTEPGHWHNQALFKKGVCLEKRADHEGALATFYQVLDTPPRSDRTPELFWFYKAGFNAARLLETESHWDSAARVYQKLVAARGSRSEEARIRLNELRLEHFLWSD